jgi:hypothetical protein
MLAPEATVEIPIKEIERREPARASAMPSALLNNLTREEVLDLLAYLEATGKPGAPNFKKEKTQARNGNE